MTALIAVVFVVIVAVLIAIAVDIDIEEVPCPKCGFNMFVLEDDRPYSKNKYVCPRCGKTFDM